MHSFEDATTQFYGLCVPTCEVLCRIEVGMGPYMGRVREPLQNRACVRMRHVFAGSCHTRNQHRFDCTTRHSSTRVSHHMDIARDVAEAAVARLKLGRIIGA